jgi:hypothetical protein
MPSSTCRPDATADWQLHIKQCLWREIAFSALNRWFLVACLR